MWPSIFDVKTEGKVIWLTSNYLILLGFLATFRCCERNGGVDALL
jgi:hypothetical protein